MTFKELGLHDDVINAIGYMGFEKATPIQEQAIPKIVEGRDLIACAQTGTGKTAAFILPIIDKLITQPHKGTNTLVIVPTRELAIQIDQQIQGFSYFTPVHSQTVYGGGSGTDYDKEKRALEIGTDINCDQRLRLDAYDSYLGYKYCPVIRIGNNVSLQKDCHIGAINKIVIGNNVLLASKVYISDHSHGEITLETLKLPPAKRPLFSKGPVIIEDNVWLGEGVVVLPGVTIGENSIVGANAVVTKSIPKNSVAAGNPARIIREII